MTKSTSSQLLIRRATLTPAILLLLFAAYLSFRWALADVFATQLRFQLTQAQYGDTPLDASQWRLTYKLLEQTLKLDSEHAGYLELAQQFYHELEYQEPSLLQELGWHDNEAKALEYGRRALLLRPSWLYLWDDLVLSKTRLEQYDTELTGAMERAIDLGPWDESVQYDVAITGLDAWDELDTAARESAVRATERAIEIQPTRIQKELSSHANFARLCENIGIANTSFLQELRRYCR